MKKIYVLILFLISLSVSAQDTIREMSLNNVGRNDIDAVYHRSSWHNILIYHEDQKYAEEILQTYNNRPQSEKFNDHSLPIDVVSTKGSKYAKFQHVDAYIMGTDIAKDLVAKWFNRNPSTGYCDMELIYRRGIEGASTEKVELADLTKRGKSILMDYGTELIGNTFVLVHDVVYIDKGERNRKTATGISFFGRLLRSIGEMMSQATGDYSYNVMGDGLGDLTDMTADIVDDYEGFRVKIKTHLYRLDWQAVDNDLFYENYYLDENYYDEAKHKSWDNAHYELSYVGSQKVKCGETVLQGKYKLSDLMRIVVYRTLDECVVKLQQNYEEFRIKEPIYSIDEDGNVIAKIGLKDGVSTRSKYEVLERIENADGSCKYKRVGKIKPIEDKIWDNRYMASEDNAVNADLGGTTFKVIKGKNLYPGLLIREIKF